MRLSFTCRSPLPPGEAIDRCADLGAHRVPFTAISRHGGDVVVARTKVGAVVVDDTMRLERRTSGGAHRVILTKLGPVLTGTVDIAGVPSGAGSTVGWRHNMRFEPLPILTPVVSLVLHVGYRVGARRLLAAR